MRKKALLVVLVVLVTMTASLYAASVGSIGLVNYGSYYDFEEGNSDFYMPGLRAEFFLSDYLGVSLDALVWDSIPELEYYNMIYFVDAVFRLPLGFVEPYIAIGPAYAQVIMGDYSSDISDSFASNVRGGIDINILETLSVGVETNFLVQDVPQFFETLSNSSSEEIQTAVKESSLIGVTLKWKF